MDTVIYQFCTLYVKSDGKLCYFDGIGEMQKEVLSIEDYRKLKENIVQIIPNEPLLTWDKLTIISLNRLK